MFKKILKFSRDLNGRINNIKNITNIYSQNVKKLSSDAIIVAKYIKDINQKLNIIQKKYNLNNDLMQFESFGSTYLSHIAYLCDELEKNNYNFHKYYENKFSKLDFFKNRNKILLKGLKSFEKKDYISSIPVLLSQFEGIVCDYALSKHNFCFKSGKYNRKENGIFVKTIKKCKYCEKQIKNEKKEYTFKEIYEICFKHIYSEKFISDVGVEIYSEKFRHGILHGALSDYDTPKNNFILVWVLFLTLEAITESNSS